MKCEQYLKFTMPPKIKPGESNVISWESFGVQYVELFFSTDNYLSWTPIAVNLYNLGCYKWTTPVRKGKYILTIREAVPEGYTGKAGDCVILESE